MRTKVDQVKVFADRIARVRTWKSTNRKKMTHREIGKCARSLGLKTTMVRDSLNVITSKPKTIVAGDLS